METRSRIVTVATLVLLSFPACDGSTPETGGSGGAKASGGSGGTSATGGSAAGGSSNTGGTSATGGSSSTGGSAAGGSSATGGKSGGASGTGGKATGGRTGTGGDSSPGGADAGTAGNGGRTGPGGRTGAGGSTGGGGSTGIDGGPKDGGSPEVGTDTVPGAWEPCPTNGDPCKILPLGDSITYGINYGGGYRIKLFTHTVTDGKNITFVGYDTGNNADSTALGKLGSAKDKWVNKHEGHSGWTIQQDDDLVTGKSTASNPASDGGANYTGKKVVADFDPHIVLVHLGTNDMYKSPSGAPDRLGTLIDHIVADAPDALVVVSNIIPFPSGASAVTTFNNAVPGVVKQRTDAGKHVIFVDQFKGFSTSDLGSDQVHPNEGGYEKMAVVWYNAIKAYLR